VRRGAVDPTGDEEESVGQDHSPQAGHGSDYNAASQPREEVPQSFKNRNSALPAVAASLTGLLLMLGGQMPPLKQTPDAG